MRIQWHYYLWWRVALRTDSIKCVLYRVCILLVAVARHMQQAMGPVRGHCQGHQPLEPQVPQFPQQPDYLLQQQLLPSSMPPPPPPPPHSGRRPPPMANEQYLCMQLQKLQQEKERLQQEQEAIACRVSWPWMKDWMNEWMNKRLGKWILMINWIN